MLIGRGYTRARKGEIMFKRREILTYLTKLAGSEALRNLLTSFWPVILGPLIFNLPRFLLRENSHFPIFDSLDSNAVWYVVASKLPLFMKPLEPVIQMLNGNAFRLSLPSELNIQFWFFKLFPPFWAIVFNDIAVRFLGALGMWLFLRELLCNNLEPEHTQKTILKVEEVKRTELENPLSLIRLSREDVINWVVLMYALLPLVTLYGLSHYGYSLILYLVLLIYKGKELKWYHYLIPLLIGAYSSIALSGYVFIGIILLLIAWFLLYSYFSRKFHEGIKHAISVLAILILSYALVNWRFIYFVITKPFISHRSEFVLSAVYTWEGVFRKILFFLFLPVQYNFSLALPVIVPVLMLALLVSVLLKDKKLFKLSLLFSLAILISASLSALSVTKLFLLVKGNLGILRGLSWVRTFWALPTLFYVAFAISLIVISEGIKYKYSKAIAIVLIGLQLGVIVFSHPELVSTTYGFPSFREYYSVNLFKKVGYRIGQPKGSYRVVCIGFAPGIAQYNGFYTLDAYLPIYPLSYKRKFFYFIREELLKNPFFLYYFQFYGNQCYSYVAELMSRDFVKENAFFMGREGDVSFSRNISADFWLIIFSSKWGNPFYVPKILNKKISDLDLNFSSLRNITSKPVYVLSALEILNYREKGLELVDRVDDSESPLEIYIYRFVDR